VEAGWCLWSGKGGFKPQAVSDHIGTRYHHLALLLIGYQLVLYSLICSQAAGQTADQPEVRDLPIGPGLGFTMGAALAGHAQVP